MNEEFVYALEELEKEKGINKEILVETIQAALISAYKRNFGSSEHVYVDLNQETGDIKVLCSKTVVEEVENKHDEISLEEARKINGAYEVGDRLETEVTPDAFGRLAAQTAKNVVVQKIKEAERGVIFDQYTEKQGEVLTATVHRIDRGKVFMEIGRAEGLMLPVEAVKNERLSLNEKIKVYITEVRKTNKGPQIMVSRTHPGLVKRLFEVEIPEIRQNVVEIKNIAREAGHRTKIAVYSTEDNVDPVGACVGQRGSRIERVVEELKGEKIDVVPWNEDSVEFIANAIRPAKVIMAQVDEETKAAKVVVPDDQLSLAIGREGQNARLAAKLTGWKIDIKSQTQAEQDMFNNREAQQEETDEDDIFEDELDFEQVLEEQPSDEASQEISEEVEEQNDQASDEITEDNEDSDELEIESEEENEDEE
jgi:transcription termination/antitermination protein NusA